MRAIVLPFSGATTVQPAEVPAPEPGPGELLVRVHAIGVGIHDSYFLPADVHYPFPIGIEAAGVVEGVVEGVNGAGSDVAVGDRITFVSSMQVKGGTWAERAVVSAASLVLPVPSGMDLVRAAAVPVAGTTVLRAFHGLPAAEEGSTLFVAGGSGAVGTFAVQIARQRGWRVAASSSPANHEYLRGLGAELTVDYRDPSWPQQVRDWAPGGVEAALAVQPGTTAGSQRAVRDGGTVIMITPDEVAAERGVQVEMLPFQVDVQQEAADLLKQVAADEVHLEIEQVYPFEDAPAALAKVQTRHARGKLVIRVD